MSESTDIPILEPYNNDTESIESIWFTCWLDASGSLTESMAIGKE